MLSKEQYLGTMLGFLSYFYSILYFEVGSEISTDDFLGFLPGSLSEGLKMKKTKGEISVGKPQKPKRILFMTGPRVAGREVIAKRLVSRVKTKNDENKREKEENKSSQLNFIKLITTDSKIAENDP